MNFLVIVASLAMLQAPQAEGLKASPATMAVADTAPVRIVNCNVIHMRGRQAAVHIGFVNATPRALSFVRFKVDFEGTNRTIDDNGLFSPGIAIHHTYATFHPGSLSSVPAACVTIAARFVDGTLWR